MSQTDGAMRFSLSCHALADDTLGARFIRLLAVIPQTVCVGALEVSNDHLNADV